MSKVNQPENLLTHIRALERRIAQLERATTLNNAVVSRGHWSVKDDDNHTLLRAGVIATQDGGQAHGLVLWGTDGIARMWVYDTPGGPGGWVFYDGEQVRIMANDDASGQGLARPWIPLGSVPTSELANPSTLTTSGTFASVHKIHGQRQHPRIRVRTVARLDAGTVGEMRLAIGGVAVSDVTPLPDGAFAYYDLTTTAGALTGAHMSELLIDVEARRVSGAGNVRVLLVYAVGRQT